MRVRIIRPAHGPLDGFEIERLHVGQTYDLPAYYAIALIAEGIAQLEMRSERRREDVDLAYSGVRDRRRH